MRQISPFVVLLTCAVALAGCGGSSGDSSTSATSATPACTPQAAITLGGPFDGAANGRALGFSFQVSVPMELSALGAFEVVDPNHRDSITLMPDPIPGITTPIEVGLYDSMGLVASGTVQATDPLIDGYRYVTIPSVMLQPGETYTILGNFHGSEAFFAWQNTPDFTYRPSVTFTAMQSVPSSPTLPAMPPGNPQSWSDQYLDVNFLACEL